MQNILAVITDWDDAGAVLARVEELADRLNTKIEVLRPVHSPLGELNKYMGFGEITELRNAIMAAERDRLEALCAGKPWALHVEWCDRVHRAIVERAEAYGAGLIVMMASHHSVLSTLVHTPDDWHLFRDAPCPILSLVRDRRPIARVIAAVDALDHSELHQQLSARVIDQGQALAKAEAVPLTVLTVVPDPTLLYAGLVNAPMGGNFHTQVMDAAMSSLQTLLARLGVTADAVEVKAGRPEDVVPALGEPGSLLVLGSAANKGLKGFWIGNTAERILHHMQSDMLVVN